MVDINNSESRSGFDFLDWAMLALLITLIVWLITMLVRK